MYKEIILLTISFALMMSVYSSAEEPISDHSRDYHLLDDQSEWERMFQHWEKHSRKRRAAISPSAQEVKDYINTFKPAFESASKVIKLLVNNSAVLTGRIKSYDSVSEKIKRTGLSMYNMTDIIGFRLTCQTVDESVRIAGLFEGKGIKKFELITKKCYGMCPGAKKYRESGYRRIHLILRIKPENKACELQIGTPYTNMFSDWHHDFFYKGPKRLSQRQDVKNYTLAVADYFWKLDEVRRKLPNCPTILQNSGALETLKQGALSGVAESTFEKLGKPPSVCFWWNDMKLAVVEKKDVKTCDTNSGNLVNIDKHFFVLITIILSAVMTLNY